MKRCILHLGMPKTASTSIQSALHANRELLQRHGWEYPEFSCPEHGNTFFLHNEPLCRLFFPRHPFHSHRAVKNGIINLGIQQKELRKNLDNIVGNSNNIILSSEALLKPLPLKRIRDYGNKNGLTIEPILYIRSPYSYRTSIYQSFLKSSLLSKTVIVQNIQNSLVKESVEAVMDVFGNDVKLYPFNSLVRSGVDIVSHFFEHFWEAQKYGKITTTQKNKSLSRQAIALLEYIEEKNPLYVDGIKSANRTPGDIRPLHQITGEKFLFDHELLAPCREIIDRENKWLAEKFGRDFCDKDYINNVAANSTTWDGKSTQSLLEQCLLLPTSIQRIIVSYFEDIAVFSSPRLKQSTLKMLNKKLRKKKQHWSVVRLKQLFPKAAKRGKLARKLYKS